MSERNGRDLDTETGEIIEHQHPQPPAVQALVPMASASCASVWSALAVAQGDFEQPKRTKEAEIKGQTRDGRAYSYKYKYAPLEEIERIIKVPLKANSLMRQQYLVSRSGQWFVRTIIGHSSGEWIASDFPIYASDNRNPAQAFASGVTYARRYGLSLALGLCPEDDDDAQATAGEGKPIAAPPDEAHAAGGTGNGDREKAAAERAKANVAYKRLVTLYNHLDTTLADLDSNGVCSREPTLRAEFDLIKRFSPQSWQKLVDTDASRRQELGAS